MLKNESMEIKNDTILEGNTDNLKDIREVTKKVSDVAMIKATFKKHFFLRLLDKKSR